MDGLMLLEKNILNWEAEEMDIEELEKLSAELLAWCGFACGGHKPDPLPGT